MGLNYRGIAIIVVIMYQTKLEGCMYRYNNNMAGLNFLFQA